MNNIPLIETYRPQEFKEVVGVEDLDRLESLISTPKDMPNLLFHGPQGTGKTTVAKIILNKLKPVDCLRINGSDETSVEVVREKVYNYMASMSSVSDKPKIVWIEEFDFMSTSAFAALRSMIEQFMKNARFICTANYLKKIPEPIQSRFSKIEFKKINDASLFTRLRDICDMEGIKVQDKVLNNIVVKSHGDLRTAINTIQQLSANEIKTISELDISKTTENVDDIYKLIDEGNWTKLRFDILEMNPDYENVLTELSVMYYNSGLTPVEKADITEIISDGLTDMAVSFDKNICAAAIFSRIIRKLGRTLI